MKTYAIISGGDYAPMPGIDRADFIIACDRGCEHAARFGVVPDVVIGDFDSFCGELPSGAKIIRLPVEKDDTDTVGALRIALSEGADKVEMYCVEGGRPDHFVGNIQAAAFAAGSGVCVKMHGEAATYCVLPRGTYEFPRKKGFFSLFSLSGSLSSVTLSGAKYTLENATLTSLFPLGVSNEWASEKITLSFSGGVALVIESEGEEV